MTHLPYTNGDLRAEAARQYAEILRDPDRLEVQDEMQGTPIPSRASDGILWQQAGVDDFHDAVNQVHELLKDAPDLSRWAVDLGANGLKTTSELTWGRHDNAWDLAIQIAHRPGLKDDLREAITAAVREVVRIVLDNRCIDDVHLLHQDPPAPGEDVPF